jgi:hypothetical protein
MTWSSAKMYKNRFTEWGLLKNLERAGKEAILQRMDAHENLSVDLGQPMLNGRLVRKHLIDCQSGFNHKPGSD